MKKTFILIFLISGTAFMNAQESNEPRNLSSEVLDRTEDKLVFGGYGQIDFFKPFSKDTRYNSSLDVTRLILSAGYKFTQKTSFFTEIEFEHVKELYVEQAFINHAFNDALNFRAGLMLVPMGIINEYHEPTTFNGVHRPTVDNIIVPTTWREIGMGFTGRFVDAGLKYQVYLFDGFSGYDGTKGLFNADKFLRDARQRGARAYMTSPDLSMKVDYFGIRGLKLGLSGYFGKSESALYKSLDLNNDAAVARADSSVTGIFMTGLDARYSTGGLSVRGQFVFSALSNTAEYNKIAKSNVGKQVYGMYGEVAYNVLHGTSSDFRLTPFFRYENYDTQFRVETGTVKQDKYKVNEYVFGLGWWLADGAVLKADVQLARSAAETTARKTFNAGLGVWF
jgi:hypothetical protein